MEQEISQETHQNELNKSKDLLKEVSSNEMNGEGETETKGEEKRKQHLLYAKRWRFQYLTIDIEQCVSSLQDSQEKKSLKDLCKYILKDSKKKELMICLSKPKSIPWFKQFYFIKQDSLKQVAEGKFFSAQGAVREMGSDYRILYDDRHPAKKTSKNKHESSSSEEEEKEDDVFLSTPEQKDDSDEEESEDENIIKTQKFKPKMTEKQQSTKFPSKLNHNSSISPFTKNLESKKSRRELLSHWYARIFRGDRISQIREELGQKGDPDSIWVFMQNLDLLKKAQNDPDLYEENHKDNHKENHTESNTESHTENHKPILRKKDILRKRPYEDHKVKEEEFEKPKKIFVKEDDEEGKKPVNLEGDSQKVSKKKKEKKDKEVRQNITEHDIIAESISFYKSPAHFKKAIASLPLFQKELAAFEATLSPEEIKVIEDAMNTGFNPIHYIYNYKIGEKSLAKIKTAFYKKCLNTPSIELIYRYISKHLQGQQKVPIKVEDEPQQEKE